MSVRPPRRALGIALGALLLGALACPKGVSRTERIVPPPPVPAGHLDLGPLGQVRLPVGLTADPAEEYDPAPSPDGRVIAYVSHRRGNADVFVRFLPGSGRVGDYPVSPHYAPDLDPAWSPTGRHLAFVSMRDDPKGDVYLYSLRRGKELDKQVRDAVLRRFGDAIAEGEAARMSEFLERWEPLTRLADSETEDRSPAWSHDGTLLYYTSRRPGEDERVYARDLAAGKRIKIVQPGHDPAPSPDGKYLAYATSACAGDADGCIGVVRLSDRKTAILTQGAGVDGFPTWTAGSDRVVFSRYSEDTNRDGKVDVKDRPALWTIRFDADSFGGEPSGAARRLTDGATYDLFPAVAGGEILYSADDGADTNVLSIPVDGLFPALADLQHEVELADGLFGEGQLQLLYLEDILARRWHDSVSGVETVALWAAGERVADGDLVGARKLYERVRARARANADPVNQAHADVGLARVALLQADDAREHRAAVHSLERLAPKLRTNGRVEAGAEAMLVLGNDALARGDRVRAAQYFARANSEFPTSWDARAEGMMARARTTAALGQAQRAVALYGEVLGELGDRPLAPWRRRHAAGERQALIDGLAVAIGKKLESAPVTPGLDPSDLPDAGAPQTYGERTALGMAAITVADSNGERDAIGRLRELARAHPEHPVVPAVIRNEIGDLYLRLGNPTAAIAEYRSAIEHGDPRQSRRARLSEARALLASAEYEQAADMLARVAGGDGVSASLAARAHQARLRVLLGRADQAFAEKDIKLARKAYRAVLEVDARSLEAHRGLIASYAALGEADRARRIYQDALGEKPKDSTLLYATGLAYTYLEPAEKWLPRARPLLEEAAALDGNAVFPHQTLGYVYEKLEELDIERRQMEKAVDQYLLALQLNRANEDPRNEAALLLNAGNAFYNLKNYHRAYDQYAQRQRSDYPFDEPLRELVFRERFAHSAFSRSRLGEAVELYDAALAFLDEIEAKKLLEAAEVVKRRARLVDERALVLSEAGETKLAAAGFLEAARLNSVAGNERNSARALRNAAIHLFRHNARVAQPDPEGLADALEHLETSLASVDEHGVVEQKKKRGGKLYTHEISVGLSDDISEAQRGFTKKGEKELIWTFVGQIYREVDDPQRALAAFEQKRALLPRRVREEQQAAFEFKRALLENQIGALHYQLGDQPQAWGSFHSAYKRSREVNNLQGMLVNADNMARVALRTREPKQVALALSLLEESLAISRESQFPGLAPVLPPLVTARAGLLVARSSLRAESGRADAATTVEKELAALRRRRADLQSAVDGLEQAVDEFAKVDPRPTRAAAWEAGMRLEAGVLHAALGDFAAAENRLADAARLADRRSLPGLRARPRLTAYALLDAPTAPALVVPGAATRTARMSDAVAELEAVPPPLLEPSFTADQVEPYYRHLAAQAQGVETIAWIERWRALRRVLDGRDHLPVPARREARALSRELRAAERRAHDASTALRESTEDANTEAWRAKSAALVEATTAWHDAAENYAVTVNVGGLLTTTAVVGPADLPPEMFSDDVRVIWLGRLPGGDLAVSLWRPDTEVPVVHRSAVDRGASPRRAAADVLRRMASADAAVPDALHLNLDGAGRVLIVPDIGLFDPDWLPASVRDTHTITMTASLAHVSAAYWGRGHFQNRVLLASRNGASQILGEAPYVDVLRLNGPRRVPAGRPADAWWETFGTRTPPRRRLGAGALTSRGVRSHLVVADVDDGTEPETLLRIAELWAHAGVGTTVFAGTAAAQRADGLAGGPTTAPLPSRLRDPSAAWLVAGYPGLTTDEAEVFAAEVYDAAMAEAKLAFREKRLDDSLAAFDRVLTLLEAQGTTRGVKGILRLQAMTASRADQTDRGAHYAQRYVAQLRAEKNEGRVLADALVLHGKLLHNNERYDEATRAFEEALLIQERLGNSKKIREARTELGISRENARDFDRALAEFERSVAIAEGLDDEVAVAAVLRKVGRIHYLYLQNNAAAEAAFTRARDIYARKAAAGGAAARRGRDDAELELGLVDERRGRLDEAREHYEGVLTRAVERKDSTLQARATLLLANVAWFGGEYQTAFNHVRQVRRIAEANDNDRLRFLSRSTEGLIHWTLNDAERSLGLQTEALQLAKSLRSQTDVASTWNNIGLVHRSEGRYEQAVASFERALAIDRELKSRWGMAYDLRNLGVTWLQSSDPRRAERPLEDAAKLASEIGDRINEAKAVLALGDLALRQEDWRKARSRYQRALEISGDVHLPEVIWRAHQGLSRVYLERGRIDESRQSLDASLAVVEDMRASIKLEEFKNSYITNKLDLYADAIQLALDHPAAGADPALESWRYSERARARSFIDLLANRPVKLSSPGDRELLRRQRDMKDAIFALEEVVARTDGAQKTDATRTLADLREQYNDLLLEIRSTNPELSAFVTVDPPTLDDVRGALRDDTALIEYYVAAEEVIVWTITSDTLEVHRIKIDRDDLRRRVSAYLEAIQNVEPVEAEGRRLHALLVEPALTRATRGKRFLGIVPHGVLHYMPWPALSDGKSMLIDRHALFTSPSAGVIHYTARRARPRQRDLAVLAIGNPDLGNHAFDLPFAEIEVSDMRFQFDEIEILTQDKATERWVIDNIERFGVIHFASHGEFDPVNPLFSSLKLARSTGADGDLAAHEVFGLRLRADLVTMSACQTGLAKIEGGDELIGLNRAFLYAGTSSILSTLWRVSDASTAILVKHFYREYDEAEKADALRDAMRAVREYYPHPAYWAAFSLTGDWR